MLWRFLLVLVPCLALALRMPIHALARTTASAALPGWMVDRYGAEDGMPTNLATGVEQDRAGAVWASTWNGLVRIDGAVLDSVRRVDNSALPGNRFIGIEASHDGSLWALEELGGLVQLRQNDGERWRSVALADGAGRFLQTIRGTTWLATTRGLVHLDASGPVRWRSDVIQQEPVALADAGDGALWVACAGGALWRVPVRGSATRMERAADAWSGGITAVADDGQGGVWAGSDGRGLFHSIGSVLHQIIAPSFGAGRRAVRELVGARGEGLAARTDEGWWTLVSGAWHAEPGMAMPDWPAQIRADSVSGSDGRWRVGPGGLYLDSSLVAAVGGRIWKIMIDRDENVWAASDRDGVVCVRRALVTALPLPSDQDAAVDAVVWVGRTLWAANHQGRLLQSHTGGAQWSAESLHLAPELVRRRTPSGLAWPDWARVDLVATSLLGEGDQALWVGTDSGVALWSPSGVLPVAFPWERGIQTVVESMHIDTGGRFWAATPGGLAMAPLAEVAAAAGQVTEPVPSWRWMAGPAGAPLESAHTFADTPGGDLFVTTGHQGLARIRGAQIELLTTSEGLSSNRLRGLLVADDGTLWVGTEDAGLCRVRFLSDAPLRLAEVRCLSRREGLLDDAVHAIVRDDQHRLWLSGNRGITVLREGDANAVADGEAADVLVLVLDQHQGMVNPEANGFRTPAHAVSTDGRVFLPTQSGLAVVQPAALVQTKAPQVSLVRVEVQGRPQVSPTGDLTMAANESLEIRWSATEFQWPERVGFRYRMGADEPWTEGGNAHHARWDALGAGNHRFEVQAGLGGVWSPSASLSVLQRPAFRDTGLFAVLICLATLAAAASVTAGLSRRQRVTRQRLEAAVESRTAELQESNACLKGQSERLGEQARRLTEQAQLLAELDRQKAIFLSNVSHELRTPLMLIKAPVAELQRRALVNDRPVLAMIERSADRLADLISQLLDAAKLQAGGMTLQASAQELDGFVRERVAAFSGAARAAGITLVVGREPAPVPMTFDPDLIDKVMCNLLVNALKFTLAGGRIEVTCQADPTQGRAVVRVSDTGIGIEPRLHAEIFKRFFQVRSGDDRLHGGMGIGLSLARELVELHGGQIGVESEPGRGSTFWFTLPLATSEIEDGPDALSDSQPTNRDEDASSASPDRNSDLRPRVLIVEDNVDMCDWLASMLEGEFSVDTAHDGVQALARIAARRPDAVVADVMMPNMDGLTLCGRLRADDRLRDLPVLLMSAKASTPDVQSGMAVARDYLIKPFTLPTLMDRLWMIVPQPRPNPVSEASTVVGDPEAPAAAVDRRFLDRLLANIEARIDDSTLSVVMLARCMALSPRQFQREVARISGRRPNELIHDVRRRCAQEFIDAGQFRTLAEVAAAVGVSPATLSRMGLSHAPDRARGSGPADLAGEP